MAHFTGEQVDLARGGEPRRRGDAGPEEESLVRAWIHPLLAFGATCEQQARGRPGNRPATIYQKYLRSVAHRLVG